MTSDEPTQTELDAIREAGRNQGVSVMARAGQCPFTPRDQAWHRVWMDGFSDGRIEGERSVAS